MVDGGPSTSSRPPVVVVDEARATLVPSGWTARIGFDLPETPWDLSSHGWVCVGVVEDDATSHAALAAVTRGVGLLVELRVSAVDRHRLLEDLDKVAAHAPSAPVGQPPVDVGGREAELLLTALARGSTITAAATEIHVSRRTANRLMADVRRRLGVATTAEAVLAWSARR